MTIGFVGQAGMGVNTAGLLLMKLLAHQGYVVHGDKEYQSIIKGGTNLFVLHISTDLPFLSQIIDHLIILDPSNEHSLAKIYTIKQSHLLRKLSRTRPINILAFAYACKLFSIDKTLGQETLHHYFVNKQQFQKKNLTAFDEGYGLVETSGIEYGASVGPSREIRFGNQAIGEGAGVAGLGFYAAYPMTPASSLIGVITKDPNCVFFQGEDEIAVSMAMLGAAFVGKLAMCGTSGGGFALMTESIGFDQQAELGGVYVLSQRDGPSTGTPTFTAQGDIGFACNASFGDVQPIVIAPSNFSNAHRLIQKSLLRAKKYRHPIIFLVDKQFSEGYLTKNPDISLSPVVGLDASNYKLGTDLQMVSSYEHDEHGATNEDPTIKKQMVDRKAQKIIDFQSNERQDDDQGYEIINSTAEKFIVSFGMNELVIKAVIAKKSEWGAIIIHCLQPKILSLDTRFKHNVDCVSKLLFVEMNRTGQFEQIIRRDYDLHRDIWADKTTHLRKYTLYPIREEELERML